MGKLPQDARTGDDPRVPVTILPSLGRHPHVPRTPPRRPSHLSPHPRPSRPRPQPARAVAETAASLTRAPASEAPSPLAQATGRQLPCLRGLDAGDLEAVALPVGARRLGD